MTIQEILINTFLSINEDSITTKIYSDDDNSSNVISVIFQIDVDSKIFASDAEYSKFSYEEKILFFINSVFCIEDKQTSDNYWY